MNEINEKFSIYYDAEDNELADHKIDAIDLGKAIVGMHHLIEEVGKKLYKDTSAISKLQVVAPAKEGSLFVDFLISAATPETINVLKYIGITSFSSSIVGGSLFEIIKKIKNREIIEVIIDKKNNQAKIVLDNETIVTDRHLGSLITEKKVRDAVHDIAYKPLSGKKDTKFKIFDGETSTFQASNDEIISFTHITDDSPEETTTKVEATTVTFTQVNFYSSKGWKITHKGKDKAAEMLDESFLQKISDKKQEFKKDDIFEVRLEREEITKKNRRKATNFKILEVTKHLANKDRKIV